jgi:ATP-dependent DNA helicase DinG
MSIFEQLKKLNLKDLLLEEREQQEQLVQSIGETLNEGGVLLAEAGTGVGKSFAYLFAAAKYAFQTQSTVVISTHTLPLQEQLFQKDIPIVLKALELQKIAPIEVVLLKGRGNYLSKRRLYLEFENSHQLELNDLNSSLSQINEWANRTSSGLISDAKFPIPKEIWGNVQSHAYHCLGSKCSSYETCFYHSVRRKSHSAHLILVNHALLLSDLSLKIDGGTGVLPEYSSVILDEAHHFVPLALDHLSTSVSVQDCLEIIRHFIFSEKKSWIPIESMQLAAEFKRAAESFFDQLTVEGFDKKNVSPGTRAVLLPEKFNSFAMVENSIRKIQNFLKQIQSVAPTEELALEVEGTFEECDELIKKFSYIIDRAWDEEACYIIEPDSQGLKKNELKAFAIKAVPLDPSALIREHFLTSVKSAVFTSATLSIDDDFSYFQRTLGLEDAVSVKMLKVGSPFDYQNNVTLYFPEVMPHPRTEEKQYIEKISQYILASIQKSNGKAFVLFTSLKMMQQTATILKGKIEQLNIRLLIQGEEGWDRSQLLAIFKKDVNSVLFGVNSFWEGVDVPGEALSNLIITKLPFKVPEGPVVEARHQRFKKSGLNPFKIESLPEAALQLKQGFGRLIRSKSDRGTVLILDPRILTESWGKTFMKVLPKCQIVYLKTPNQLLEK